MIKAFFVILTCFISQVCFSDETLQSSTESLLSPQSDNQSTQEYETRTLERAISRKHDLEKSLTKNTDLVYHSLIDNHLRDQLPVEAQAHVEEEVSDITGTFKTYAVCHPTSGKKHSYKHMLHQDNGTHTQLFLSSSHELPAQGSRIKVHTAYHIPTLSDGKVLLPVLKNSHEELINNNWMEVLPSEEPLPEDESAFTPSTVSALSLTEGSSPSTLPAEKKLQTRKVLVNLLNFSDQPKNFPKTVDQVKTIVFTQLDRFLRENSSGTLSVQGDVTNWTTLDVPSTGPCDSTFLYDTVVKQAAQAAINQHFDPTAYPYQIYIFPEKSTCSFAGLGTVSGKIGAITSSMSWINGYITLDTIGHEFGHNLGLLHSHTLSNGYGDFADIMAVGAPGYFNAFQRERLGWLNAPGYPPITTVTQTGTYKIAAYEGKAAGPKALKILKSNTGVDANTYYYLESRNKIGHDECLGQYFNNKLGFTGVLLHSGNLNNPDSSYLLAPGAGPNAGYFSFATGQVFQDLNVPTSINQTGVSIKLLEKDSEGGANFQITFGGGVNTKNNCIHQPPTLSLDLISASTSSYSLSVKNNDDPAQCDPSLFVLSGNISGFVYSSQSFNLTVDPGKTGAYPLKISKNNAIVIPPGPYPIELTVTNKDAQPPIVKTVQGTYNNNT